MMRVLIVLMLLFPFAVNAERVVKLTYENVDSFPWTMKDGSGIDIILLDMTDAALDDVKFEYVQAPWKRCLDNIKSGMTEGCFTASYKEKRLEFGYYPGTHKADQPDTSLQLHASSYSLYVPKDSSINVTGNMAIEGLNGKIAAPRGYSIGDDLAKEGYAIDANASNTLNNFKKLVDGRVEAVAALTLNGDNLLSKNPNLSSKIKGISEPLVNKPYYLMFSKQFVNGNTELAEKIWKTAAEIRESQEFKDKAGAFLSQ